MKPKVIIFDGKKKNAISTSGFQDKQTFYILVILSGFSLGRLHMGGGDLSPHTGEQVQGDKALMGGT